MDKVCFILPTLHSGGSENYALRFLTFASGQIDVTVISIAQEKGDLHEAFENVGVQIIYKKLGYFSLERFYSFYLFFKSFDFDVVCTFNGNFGGILLLLAKIAGVNQRIALYRRSTNAFKSNLFKLGYNRIAQFLVRKYATKVLSNSRSAFEYFHGEYFEKDNRYKIIPNGVDEQIYKIPYSQFEAREKLGLPCDTFIIGHVGRYDYAKNHETILKVAKEIRSKISNVIFVFCGKGTDGTLFKEKIDGYGITSSVYCLGIQTDVPLVLKSFDVFYFPSVTEGQPNALIEAMLSDLPIVTSNISSIMECVPKDFHKKLYPPLDYQKHCDILLQLLQNKNLRQQYQLKSFASIHFNYKTRFTEFLNVIMEKPKNILI